MLFQLMALRLRTAAIAGFYQSIALREAGNRCCELGFLTCRA